MTDELTKINNRLIEILSQEKGYFGRINTYGLRPTNNQFNGYELTESFYPVLEKMSEKQRKNLTRTITYFEIRANPLKKLLDFEMQQTLYDFYSIISWSQFMTVIMFGMLEIVIKEKSWARLNKKGELIDKGNQIKKFLNENLSEETKTDITKYYLVDKVFKYEKEIKSFSDVIDHLWSEIRCGFIHNGGIESRGLEWTTFKGIGTKEAPIMIGRETTIQDLLQMTWQAILNSYGYTGRLELSKYK